MATPSSILTWKIPWTEEPDGLRSMGSQRVRHDWSYLAHTPCSHVYPPVPNSAKTPVFILPSFFSPFFLFLHNKIPRFIWVKVHPGSNHIPQPPLTFSGNHITGSGHDQKYYESFPDKTQGRPAIGLCYGAPGSHILRWKASQRSRPFSVLVPE